VRRREPLVQLPGALGLAGGAQPLELANVAGEGAGADVGGAGGELVADGGGCDEVSRVQGGGELRQRLRGPGLNRSTSFEYRSVRSSPRRRRRRATAAASTLVSRSLGALVLAATAPRALKRRTTRAHSSSVYGLVSMSSMPAVRHASR